MKTLRRACTAPVLALALACAPTDDPALDVPDPRASPAPVPTDTVSEATVRDASPAAYGSFGLRLFRGVEGASPGRNVFLSPVSAGVALSLAYHGAEGETRDEMARALGFGGMEAEEVARANAAMRAALASPSIELHLASALWGQQGAVFRPAYLEVARRSYGAEVAAIDFTNPAAKARIDAWISEATRGRIRGLSGEPDPSTVLLITSAVYFKGKWADPFEPEATRPLPFHRPDGSTVDAPMMSRVGGYGYLDGDGFRAVRMPYQGGRFAMYVLLPDSGSTPRALVGGLDAARWDGWMRELAETEVALTLPRFTWHGGMGLGGPLREMGMRRAFDGGRADFGGMLEPASLAAMPGRAFIQSVFQQAFVEVTEEGTEAAAVTDIAIAMDSVATPPPTPFVVDRPFLFAIRDDRTGALLFIGQVNDPSDKGDTDGG